MQSLGAHNAWAEANAAPQVEVLRMSLFSSNIYKMKTTMLDEVAPAIWAGISKRLVGPSNTLVEVQMPVTSPGARPDYFDAVKRLLTS